MTSVTDNSSFLDALLDAAVDAIIIIDQNARIERFNKSAQSMFGYREQEILNCNVSMLMPEPTRTHHDGYIESYLQTGEAAIIGIGREVLGLRKNGDVFPMRLSVGESRQQDRVHFVGIVHDLSQRQATEEKVKTLEQQLFHADRLLTLSELTAGIAHEINQPLTAIAAYADAARHLIEKGPDPTDPALHGICTRISAQSRRAAAVVDRLRKLVRSGNANKARYNITNIIDSMLLLFDFELKKSGIVLRVKAPETLPEVFVDEIQIQQILVNLVKNSIDALLEIGQQDGKIDICIYQQGTELAIAVEDNGPGVSDESLPHLFEPFYTSKPKGVGLGLSICKHIASAHGGSLSYARSNMGISQFTLKLPLSFIG